MADQRIPLYASRSTLAELLDCSAGTIDVYTKNGYLPRPEIIGNMPRWNVATVLSHIAQMNQGGVIEEDDFMKALGNGSAKEA